MAASITHVQWTGLACRVTVEGGAGLTADLRTRAGNPATSVTTPKPLGPDEKSRLLVSDDTLERSAALVVIVGPDGDVRA